MRLGTLLLAIGGGMIGLFLASVELVFQGVDYGALPPAVERTYMAHLGFSMLGLVGGALAMAKPRAAALLLLVAFLGVAVATGLMYYLSDKGEISSAGFVEVGLALPFFFLGAFLLFLHILLRSKSRSAPDS